MAGPGPGPAEGTVEARVLALLGPEGVGTDDLSRRLAIGVPELMSVLMVLELKRCVTRMPGNRFRRT